MKRYDFYIIAFILIVSGVFYAYSLWGSSNKKMTVEIYVSGELYKSVPLSDNEQTLEINTQYGQNILKVCKDGIKVLSADCPTQTCVHTPKQSISGAVIACLPHKILIKLTGSNNSEVDIIAK